MKNLFKIMCAFVLLTLSGCSDDWNHIEPLGLERPLITQSSPLFELIQKVTDAGDNPMNEIVCIDFIYPFTLLIYNENEEVIGTYSLGGDEEFSAFLETLSSGQAISISYPIKTTLADGTEFIVNNNDQLKTAIDSCAREELISLCSGLFGGDPTCVWQVPFSVNGDTSYSSGVFSANMDGTIKFHYNGQNYNGTWTFLYVKDEFQININLGGTSAVAQYWNFSRKITMTETEITINNGTSNIILEKKCEQTASIAVGAQGSGGGIVFYDKGSYSNGWRYMEVSTTNLANSEWGCLSATILNTSADIGKGFYNSVQVVNFHNSLANYYTNPGICNALNDGTVISKTALLYNSQDWFLPSEQELLLIYQNLSSQNIGNISATTYWSSTEIDQSTVKGINFETGHTISVAKKPQTDVSARAIRYF